MVKNIAFSQILVFFFQLCNQYALRKFLRCITCRSKSVTFLSLRDPEAAPEKAMQLRRLIKSSNESLGQYLFGKIEF